MKYYVAKNVQLKGKKVSLDASLAQGRADFYKLGYVDHLFGRPSDYEFVGKYLETLFVSPNDMLDFSFEATLGKIIGDYDAQKGHMRMVSPRLGAAEGECMKMLLFGAMWLLKMCRPSSQEVSKLLKISLFR